MLPALVIALALTWGAPGCGGDETAAPTRPDIVLIVIDTARSDHFSCYGYPRDTTPEIDKLALDGVVYRGATSPAPWTLPAHASIFTGLPPGEHGLCWSPTARGAGMPRVGGLTSVGSERLLARLLKRFGYTTIGITNNPWISARYGFGDGFDRFHELWRTRVSRDLRAAYDEWPAPWRVPPEIQSGRAGLSVALLKKELDELEAPRPYFAFLNLIEPHMPYRPNRAFRGRFGGTLARKEGKETRTKERKELSMLAGILRPDPDSLTALYDEELAYVDAVVGHLCRWLKDENRYHDCMIIVTSDHGEHLGEDGRYSHQLSVEQELLGVPLIIKYPGNRSAGTVDENPLVSTTDVYETVLAAVRVASSSRDPWSQDLGRQGAFDRVWTLSEYYYSTAYLEQLRDLNPDFDLERHQVVRRVVLHGKGRHVFHEVTPVRSAGPSGEARVEVPASLVAELHAYVDGLAGGNVTSDSDPEAVDALRALGYVD